MLVLDRTADTYPDDVDRTVRHVLPVGLAPRPGPDGVAQAMLTRGPDGGLLCLRLGAVWPALRPGDRPIVFDSGRFRLVLRTPGAQEAGGWWPTAVVGATIVDRSVSLEPVEAAIARRLGEANGDVVDVEVELTLRGLAPAFPWLASVDRTSLRARMAPLLRATPASLADIEAAFLGLTLDTFTWHPLQAGALPPPRDDALRALAHYAIAELFVASESGFVLAEGGTPRLDLNLFVPRIQTRTVGLRWSFSEFLAAQADPGKHLIDITAPAPFVAADLCVVNDVPLAPRGVTSIALEIRTGGPTGLLRHEFRIGEPSAARLRFVRQSAEPLNIRWRARVSLVTASGPAVIDVDERASGQLVEVDAATLGLRALRFVAQKDVFDHVAALEIAIGNRTLALTAAEPEAWAVGRQPPEFVAITARRASTERFPLGKFACGQSGVTIDAGMLGVGEYAVVTLRPPADLAQRAAYLAVQVEGHPWRTVEPGGEVTVPVRRATRFDPPRVRHRNRIVARDAGGVTSVISESAWRDRAGETVQLEL